VPCRVAYDADMLAALATAVSAGELGADDRAGLLTDALALCKAGHASMPAAQLLRLLGAYTGERHATVWSAIAAVLTSVDNALLGVGAEGTEAREAFAAFAARLVAPAAAAVGWESRADDGHLSKLVRMTLVELEARFCSGDPAVQAKARALWDAIMAGDKDACPSDIKVAVFKIVAKGGGEAEYGALMAHLARCDNDTDRKHVYAAMGCFPSTALQMRVLDWALGGSGNIKLQDFFYPIGSVSGSSAAGLELTWATFRTRFAEISTMLKKSVSWMMDALILSSVSGFATAARADEVEAFFRANPLPQSARKISQAVENIRVSAAYCGRLVSSEPPIATVVAGLC